MSQSIGTLGLAMECQEAFTDIQIRNKPFMDKLASTEERIKKIKAKVEEMRAQRVKDAVKLESALA